MIEAGICGVRVVCHPKIYDDLTLLWSIPEIVATVQSAGLSKFPERSFSFGT